MPADQWPYLVEFSREHVLKPGYDYGQESEWGFDLVLRRTRGVCRRRE
jgi:hypothetical protein